MKEACKHVDKYSNNNTAIRYVECGIATTWKYQGDRKPEMEIQKIDHMSSHDPIYQIAKRSADKHAKRYLHGLSVQLKTVAKLIDRPQGNECEDGQNLTMPGKYPPGGSFITDVYDVKKTGDDLNYVGILWIVVTFERNVFYDPKLCELIQQEHNGCYSE